MKKVELSSGFYKNFAISFLIVFLLNILPIYFDINNMRYDNVLSGSYLSFLFIAYLPMVSPLIYFLLLILFVYKIEKKIKADITIHANNIKCYSNKLKLFSIFNLVFMTIYVIFYFLLIYFSFRDEYNYIAEPVTLWVMNIVAIVVYVVLKFRLLIYDEKYQENLTSFIRCISENNIISKNFIKIVVLSYINLVILSVLVPALIFDVRFVFDDIVVFLSPFIFYNLCVLLSLFLVINILSYASFLSNNDEIICNNGNDNFGVINFLIKKYYVYGILIIILSLAVMSLSNYKFSKHFITLIKSNNMSTVTLYLLHQVDFKEENNNDDSPLLIACKNNQTDIVNLLLYFGANPDIMNTDNRTPLHLAVILKNIQMVKDIVLDQNNINALDKFGYSALHYAASNQSNDIVTILINNGAIVNIRADKSGITPLHSACSHEDYQSVSILLSAGADINFQDKLKQTPLYRAGVNNNHPNMASYLIDHGADINNKDVYGLTVLDYAKRYRYKEVIEILEKEKRRKYTDVLQGR